MPELKQNQFGIQKLFLATVFVAFAIVIVQFLLDHGRTTITYTVVAAGIAGVIGLTMASAAILLAGMILLVEDCRKTRKQNLTECAQMFCFGVLGMVPITMAVLLITFS